MDIFWPGFQDVLARCIWWLCVRRAIWVHLVSVEPLSFSCIHFCTKDRSFHRLFDDSGCISKILAEIQQYCEQTKLKVGIRHLIFYHLSLFKYKWHHAVRGVLSSCYKLQTCRHPTLGQEYFWSSVKTETFCNLRYIKTDQQKPFTLTLTSVWTRELSIIRQVWNSVLTLNHFCARWSHCGKNKWKGRKSDKMIISDRVRQFYSSKKCRTW